MGVEYGVGGEDDGTGELRLGIMSSVSILKTHFAALATGRSSETTGTCTQVSAMRDCLFGAEIGSATRVSLFGSRELFAEAVFQGEVSCV